MREFVWLFEFVYIFFAVPVCLYIMYRLGRDAHGAWFFVAMPVMFIFLGNFTPLLYIADLFNLPELIDVRVWYGMIATVIVAVYVIGRRHRKVPIEAGE